jgi:hypothetical protein
MLIENIVGCAKVEVIIFIIFYFCFKRPLHVRFSVELVEAPGIFLCDFTFSKIPGASIPQKISTRISHTIQIQTFLFPGSRNPISQYRLIT